MDNSGVEPIRVGLLDDQRLVREALGALLEENGAAKVVCSLSQSDALDSDSTNNPAVVLIGFDAQLHDPIATVQRAVRRLPDVPLCALLAFDRPGTVQQAMAVGCEGAVSAEAPVEVVIAAIRSLVAGEAYVDPKLGGYLLSAQLGPKHANGRSRVRKNEGGAAGNRGTSGE